ncbi:MAG: hypothetical protein MUF78_09445 [Candidatus Edwardsbacteria bacterium]|jgi:hypothetical protein|nr:hypothetical protein [Candidatus Edwardsbacteria bacterium]
MAIPPERATRSTAPDSTLSDLLAGVAFGRGAAAGGRYFSVREVLARGRRIGYAGTMMTYVSNLDALVGVVRGSAFAIAVDLTDEREYRAFYDACARGAWLEIELYRVPRAELRHCGDEGRVPAAEVDRLIAELRRGGDATEMYNQQG